VVDSKGKELRNRNVVNDRKVLARELAGLRKGTQVAFEAAYAVGWVAELCEQVGLEPHLAHASGCRAIADAKLLYDRLDAGTLANLLLGVSGRGLVGAGRGPRAAAPAAPAGLAGAAAHRGQEPHPSPTGRRGHPGRVSLWTWAGTEWLDGLDLSVMHRWTVGDCQVLIGVLEQRISSLEAEIRRRTVPDKRVAALQAIPGIGLLSAMTLVAVIGDITRFATSKSCAPGPG
jgi:hypothetical protein